MADLNEHDIFGTGSPLRSLVDELGEMYPPYTPTPRDTDREIMYRAGQRSVVEYILQKLEKDV